MEELSMVDTEVGSLAVRTMGEGHSTVLWHSLFMDDRSWDAMVSEFPAGRRLIRVTGPGHGGSGDPGRRYTMEQCARAAVTVLDAVGVDGAVDWVGNAWGGHVGVVFAARWPGRCRTLVTIGTPLQALSPLERARTGVLLVCYRVLGMTGFLQDAIAGVLLSPATRARNPVATSLVRDCLSNADPVALRNAVVSVSMQRKDSLALLADISAPTLMITGSDHRGWTPDQAQHAATLLSDGSASTIPDSAYLGPLEAPTAAATMVSQFWATHAAPSPST